MTNSTAHPASPRTRPPVDAPSSGQGGEAIDLSQLNVPGLTPDAKLRMAFRLVNTEVGPLVSSLFATFGDSKPISFLHREKAVPNVLAIQIRQRLFDKIGAQIQETATSCVSIEEIDNNVLAVIAVPIFDLNGQSDLDGQPSTATRQRSVAGSFVIAMPVPVNGIGVLRDRMRWIETLAYFATRPTAQANESSSEKDHGVDRAAAITRAMASGSTEKLAMELVNHLNGSLGLEQVAVGHVKGHSIQLLAISGVSEVKKNSPGVKQISQAMLECLDNRSVICCPPVDDLGQATADVIHSRWSSTLGGASVGSIPIMVGEHIELVLAWSRASGKPIKKRDIEVMQQTLEAVAPAVGVMTRSARGPLRCFLDYTAEQFCGTLKSPVRGLIVIAISALVYWMLFGMSIYKPKLGAELAPALTYSVASPFDGVLEKVHVKEGQSVRKGDPLFEMDTRSLLLERDLMRSRQREGKVKLSAALVQRDADAMAVAAAQLEVFKSQLAAVDYRIAEAVVRAEMDGLIAKSDLPKQIGQPFALGDPLLELIATDQWQVKIRVPDSVSTEILVGQIGTFVPVGRPHESFDIRLETFSGSAESINGQNVFIANANVDGSESWMRSGMSGVAELKTRQRPNYWIWFHDLWDWTRLQTWH